MANKRQGGKAASPNSMMLRRTLFLLIVCGIVAFLVLVIRLFKLQIIDHEFYETKAITNQVREVTVNAQRGTIYDANGKILAMSASTESVYISPVELNRYDLKDYTKEFIAENLAEILDVDYQSILDKMGDSKSWYKTIARQLEPEVSEKVRAFKNEYELVGVHLEEDSKRYYPYSSLAAHVIGFVGSENKGLAGLESLYNEKLSGINGRVVRAKNAAGTDMMFTSFEDYYDAVDGGDMTTTIDSTIQYYLEKHLEQAVADYDIQNGAGAIAMNVKTGAILGMASLGNFDLNNYQIISDEAQALIDSETASITDPDEASAKRASMINDAQQLMWRNKTISDTYEPGSTFKIITLSMALNENAVSESGDFYCGGSVPVLGRSADNPVKCWKAGGHGSQTLTQALQHSCNVAFVKIGDAVGAEKFYEYCEAFGFFESSENKKASLSGKTGIDLLGEARSLWWSEETFEDPNNKSQLAAASFGQTFTITPLQLITAVSACCNGGYLMKPYTVEEITDPESGEVLYEGGPTVVRQVISEETSAKVCHMLEQVVGDPKEGTGKNAYVAGYRIGGKTGTSTNTQKEATTGVKEYIVSFLGVAPMDDPEIAVLVFLDNPSSKSGIYVSGGNMGAPTVGKIFADILPYMGFEPEYSEEEKTTIDRSVPGIEGLSLEEAVAKLTESGFTYRTIGTGAVVTDQLPAENSIIAAGSQVIIYCDSTPSASLETMPDLTNLSYSIARQRLAAYGLYIRASGPVLEPDKVLVTNQSVAAGTALEHGTVIQVTVTDKSNEGRY